MKRLLLIGSLFIYSQISCCQSGFRKCHSTETLLFRLPSVTYEAVVSSQLTLLAMFNISVTLDTINHEILVKRPQFFCLASLATFSWLGSCLSEHSLCVVQGHPDPHGCYLYDIPKGLMLGSLPHITYTSAIGSLLTASVC